MSLIDLFTSFISNKENPNDSPTYSKNGFLIVSSFDEIFTSDLLSYIKKGTLCFYPGGSLFLLKQSEPLYKNPITRENYSTSYDHPLVKDLYKPYNLNIVEPSYYVSQGEGKWLLYFEGDLSYILYNPFNSVNFTWNKSQYKDYCHRIGYQDSGCYCQDLTNDDENPGNNKCLSAYLQSESTARSFLKSVNTAKNPENDAAIDSIRARCGCNSICGKFLSSSKLPVVVNQQNNQQCSSINSITICGVSLNADTAGVINTKDINIQQKCGQSSPTVQPTIPSQPTQSSNGVKIIIGVSITILVFILIILFFYIFNK